MDESRDGLRVRVDVVVSGAAILLVAGALHGTVASGLGDLRTDRSSGLAAASFVPTSSTAVVAATAGAGSVAVRGAESGAGARAAVATVTIAGDAAATVSPVGDAGATVSPAGAAAASGTAGSALALARRLPVKGRAPRTGYSRARFGPAWYDADRNGCDTRHDVLRRDLVRRVAEPGTGGCVTVSGDLTDPYTGAALQLRPGRPVVVDVDHVVSLSDAWQTGARSWTAQRRLAFANDPLNLLATSVTANRSKADSDAASWLPPRRGYRCAFVARQTAVKTKYHLWATAAERAAIVQVLRGCPTLKAPTGGLSLTDLGGGTGSTTGTVTGAVTAGAFCSQHAWYGYTVTRVRMRCTTSATESRYRWRRV